MNITRKLLRFIIQIYEKNTHSYTSGVAFFAKLIKYKFHCGYMLRKICAYKRTRFFNLNIKDCTRKGIHSVPSFRMQKPNAALFAAC